MARGLALLAILAAGAVGAREVWEREALPPPAALCDQPLEVVEDGRSRLGCATDPELVHCPVTSGDRVTLPGCQREAGAMQGALRMVVGLPLDINRATAEELELIRGIGARTAAAIVEYRHTHGPFVTLEELTAVKGIGAKMLERFRTQLAVMPQAPPTAPRPEGATTTPR